ncbi:ribonuclease HII [Candidatus Fervidibacter sacchari]|uniref:Ribonuclease HII n=2 Tax=Candidatus Fervidibacter sacchari TaxID=1448929 RepID=A0ABT2EQQ8_9BACT|nr:ribonuclease HII [Candidatus Fervidibacter sacchari]
MRKVSLSRERWTPETAMVRLKQMVEMGLTVVGVDEAGRGPLAGPVIAAAVVLPHEILLAEPSPFQDSKKLSPQEREELFHLLRQCGAKFAIGKASSQEIDSLNIRQATLLAMKRAVENLIHRHRISQVDLALVDGDRLGDLGIPSLFIVDGDEVCPLISAASIVAKVVRDRLMVAYDKRYPQYGFAKHKGYPTREHIEAIRKFGPCPIHRLSFSPVKEIGAEASER